MLYTSTNVMGNIHEAAMLANTFPAHVRAAIFQFVPKSGHESIIVFRTASREDMSFIRSFFGQTPLGPVPA